MSSVFDQPTDPTSSLLTADRADAVSRKTPQVFEPLDQFVGKICDRIEGEDRPSRLGRKGKIYRNHSYYRDNQSGVYNAVLDRWVQSEEDDFRSINFIRQYVDRVVKQFEQSKTEIKVRPRTAKMKQTGAAHLGDEIAKVIQEQLFTALFRQREAKYCKLSGEYYRLIYWDETKGPLKPQPIMQSQTMQMGRESWQCDCGEAGYPEQLDNGLCPSCGSDQFQVMPPDEAEIQVQAGMQMVPSGDWVLEGPDPLEIDLPLRARTFKEALWVRRKRFVPREIVEAKFPDFQIESYGEVDPVLTMQRQLETQTGANSNQTISTWALAGEFVLFEQVWLMREMYLKWTSPQDEKLASGAMLRKGEKLIDRCPSGLYIARINSKLVDLREEDKNDHWSHGLNIVVPGAIHGDGIEDLIGLQDLSNDLHSLVIQHLMRASASAFVYDQETYQLEEFPNRPGMGVPATMRPGVSLPETIYQLSPGQLDGFVAEYIEETKRNMLEIAGAFSLEAGAPDVNNKTARAAQLTHDSAVALNGLVLSLKAEVDVTTITQALKLARKHWDSPRYFPVMGELGELEVKEFQASDIPEDFLVYAVQDSWMPRSQTEQREDFVNALSSGILNPQSPDVQRYGLQCFNVPISVDSTSIDHQLAEAKLARLQQEFEITMQAAQTAPANPQSIIQTVLAAVPIKPFVDEPQVGTAVIAHWLKTDEGQNCNPALEQILMMRIQEYLQLDVAVKQMAQQKQMEENAPAQAMQQQQMMQSMAAKSAMDASAKGNGNPPPEPPGTNNVGSLPQLPPLQGGVQLGA